MFKYFYIIVKILAKDIFAPSPPSGLLTIAAKNVIALTWDVNQEADLAGYRVWRKDMEGGEFVPLTPLPIRENAFNDTEVEKNVKYYYAVTAKDRSGNESEKSAIVFEIIMEGIHEDLPL